MKNDKSQFKQRQTTELSAIDIVEKDRMLPQLSGIILEDMTELTLAEVSCACAVNVECIVELVEEGVLEPVGHEPHCWRFSGIHMRRAIVALRLQRDLGINLAGAALALQLLDEVDTLRVRLRVLGGY